MKCTEHITNFTPYKLHMKLIYLYLQATHTSRWPITLECDVMLYILKTDFCVIWWYVMFTPNIFLSYIDRVYCYGN